MLFGSPGTFNFHATRCICSVPVFTVMIHGLDIGLSCEPNSQLMFCTTSKTEGGVGPSKIDVSTPSLSTDRSKAVVLFWFSVARFR